MNLGLVVIRYGESLYQLDVGRPKEVPEFLGFPDNQLILLRYFKSVLTFCSMISLRLLEPVSGLPSEDGGGVISDPLIKLLQLMKQSSQRLVKSERLLLKPKKVETWFLLMLVKSFLMR